MEAMPRALQRGLDLLQQLAASGSEGLRFGELRSALGVPENSLARLLAGLRDAGWIERVGDRYRSLAQTAALARPLSPFERLAHAGRRIARALAEATRNTALVIGWDGEFMHCLARATHPEAVPLQRPGRAARNWHHPPWGWFFKGAAYWRRCGPRIGGGGPQAHDILVELAHLERHGWCCDRQRDRRRLATPLRVGGRIVGALAVGGTAISLHDDDLAAVGRSLVAHARGLELWLG